MRTTILIATVATTALSGIATAQMVQMRRPPVIQAGPPATVANIAPRLRPPPSIYLNPDGIRQRVPAALMPPNLTADFQLTPAVPSVAGRGSLAIEGIVSVPTPLPPGFPGQATIRRTTSFSTGAAYGKVGITFRAAKNQFYAVDCLVMANGTARTDGLYYKITGAGPAQMGRIVPVSGHIVFNVRRPDVTGDVDIVFYPDPAELTANGVINEVDFWGCQFSGG